MGKAVSIHGEALEVGDLLLCRTLKRDACLTLVQQYRLIINEVIATDAL